MTWVSEPEEKGWFCQTRETRDTSMRESKEDKSLNKRFKRWIP